MELCGEAQDGVECLEMVRQLQPDVLLLDLEMPRLHGLGVLDRLRAREPGAAGDYVQRVYGAGSAVDGGCAGARCVGLCDEAKCAERFCAAMRVLSEQLLPKIAALADGRSRRRHKGSSGDSVRLRKQSTQRQMGR